MRHTARFREYGAIDAAVWASDPDCDELRHGFASRRLRAKHTPCRALPDWVGLHAGVTNDAANVRFGTFLTSDRHRLEANYYDYRRALKRQIRRFGPVRKMRLDASGAGRASERVVRHKPAEEMAD